MNVYLNYFNSKLAQNNVETGFHMSKPVIIYVFRLTNKDICKLPVIVVESGIPV